MSHVEKRIFVGNLKHNVEGVLNDLYERFSKFGRCLDPEFDNKGSFAYLSMEFPDENSFLKLKNSFHNVKFKENLLKIDTAKPDWKESWSKQHDQDLKINMIKERLQKEKEWKFHKKLENISMSWKDHRDVMNGRIRKTPRQKSQLRNITFRIDVNGSLKVYKCYKIKLWGYEKNKDLRDLVYTFIDKKWRNGSNHIVDRLDYSRATHSIHLRSGKDRITISATSHPTDSKTEDADNNIEEGDNIEEEVLKVEKQKNTDVLNQVLQGFNFDKPMDMEDEAINEEYGASDYELEHQFGDSDSDREVSNKNLNKSLDKPKEKKNGETSYNNYEDKTSRHKKNTEEDSYEGEDEDKEFIPTFGNKQADTQAPEVASGTISNVNTLRTLFNPQDESKSSSFKLIEESDDDIDKNKNINNDDDFDASNKNAQSINDKNLSNQYHTLKYRLFFPHLDSPFLTGQTQLVKVKDSSKDNLLDNWEEEFRENRILWLKEMKRKRRDAVRQLAKKRSKNITSALL
ncbi:hypothetical protein TBLA_0I00580 [Henningerozyma blattae CBS 6284]|uniref:RRM domain-containing protein n=1 Tax=Henningerozyma blattae (strain ATCC 34711 / CBS 6284 / DSM 70876 / NBRC 10599 / NRRL Y-10934 / UCD 77-7) TaxID=1071380 RepID=I2H8L6_HENB6|nr:hypothetical protein TBLA_0I00580 [Tetrapisispora blattae CBS 6284]CCH62718.1 hypothetical protein TBLA_0I00580 [Tetrapisispora blattae CBS 6284]